MAKENTVDQPSKRPDQNLIALLSRFTEQLTGLFDVKLELLKTELREEASSYASRASLIAAGAVVAIIGFILLSAGIGFLVSMTFDSADFSPSARYGLGFVITALLYLITGITIVLMAKRRLAKQSMIPKRSVLELKRDERWLQKEF